MRIPVQWHYNREFVYMKDRLTAIGEIAGKNEGWLTGKTAWDLGCGSPLSSNYDHRGSGDGYQSWLPRVLKIHAQADPIIGVDLFPGDPKDSDFYQHLEANLLHLLKADNLVKFAAEHGSPANSISLLHTNLTIDSVGPTMRSQLIKERMGMHEELNLQQNLIEQAGMLLTTDGVMVMGRKVYRQTPQNQLELIKEMER